MRSLTALLLALLLAAPAALAQEVTGLAGWSVFLDPGHGGSNQNVGAFGYSEADKVLNIGLELREMLLATTDIDTVFMSRTRDVDLSLTQRVDLANRSGAAFFQSIHSNAGPPTAAYTLTLWPQLRTGAPATPLGGKPMAEIMVDALTVAMRVPTVGARGECDFYGPSSCRTPGTLVSGFVNRKGSRNFVQGFTAMPSSLSEAGFHTNTRQNQLNMNAFWKRLEAKAMYWSMLAYNGVDIPEERIATGIATDIDTGLPLNGVTLTLGDQAYITDTYESLFDRYSNDPDQLRNGFYYFEDLPDGVLTLTATKDDYLPFEVTVEPADTGLTFLDFEMISTRPPQVASATPFDGAENVRIIDVIMLEFDRQMDRAAVEDAFSIEPAVDVTFNWSSEDRRLVIAPDTLLPQTAYTVTIGEAAEGRFGHGFDGDGDGAAGGAFTLNFTTGFPDYEPPFLVASTPRVNARDVERRPVVSVVYNEPVDPASLEGRVRLVEQATEAPVPGEVASYVVDEQSLVSFFPAEVLDANTAYQLILDAGIEDRFNNTLGRAQSARFTTGAEQPVVTVLDDFEDGVDAWWVPQQSGSTTGIVIDSTLVAADTGIALLFGGGRQALRLQYEWDPDADTWLIRQYLPPGAAPNRVFEASEDVTLGLYVFGDGSGNQVRFAVDDDLNGAGGHEVSPWVTIDWLGWRLVEWNPVTGGTGTWIGDGTVTGPLRFDSIQLTHVPDADVAGTLVFDDLRLSSQVATAIATADELPERTVLEPAYPNPFNPSTTLQFRLPEPETVRLTVYDLMGREVAVLADGTLPAGLHTARWDGRTAAGMVAGSGVYLVRLETSTTQHTQHVVLAK